ncbi:MAG: hypothetical protein RR370_02805 [Synergistaceae bacterium]
MANILQLEGQKFNKLTVIEYTYSKNKSRYFKCLCDCGETIIIKGSSIKNGNTKSCGCLNHGEAKKFAESIVGRKVGRLTVVEYAGKSKKGSNQYKCLCDCGNESTVIFSQLYKETTLSCGCLRYEKLREANSKRHEKRKNQYFEEVDICYFTIQDKHGNIHKVLIDKDDIEKCKQYQWSYSDSGRSVYINNTRVGGVHRFIMNAKKGQIVDHIYHDTLDNRKSMLRLCTPSQNSRNRKIKGYYKELSKYVVNIKVGDEIIKGGRYNTEEEAIKARRALELEHFGEFAYKKTKDQVAFCDVLSL